MRFGASRAFGGLQRGKSTSLKRDGGMFLKQQPRARWNLHLETEKKDRHIHIELEIPWNIKYTSILKMILPG